MVINNGFNFTNNKGFYYFEDNIIKFTSHSNKIQIYSPLQKNSNSISFELASIRPNDIDGILDFCNKYGLLIPCDEVFIPGDKKDLPMFNPYLRLDFYNLIITKLTLLLDLKDALDSSNYPEILRISLNLTFQPYIELYQKEEYLYPHITAFYSLVSSYKDLLQRGIAYIENNEINIQNLSPLEQMIICLRESASEEYDLYAAEGTYNDFHKIVEYCIKNKINISKSLNGKYNFNNPVGTIPFSVQESILSYAKLIISDEININVQTIKPQLIYDNIVIGDWSIPNLLSAIYLELFLKFSENTRIKKCENPTCSEYFEIPSNNTVKKYCSTRCAQLMAKRKQREREKQNN